MIMRPKDDDKMLMRAKDARGKSAKTKRLDRQLKMDLALYKEALSKDVIVKRDRIQHNVENIGKPEGQTNGEESREQNEWDDEVDGEEEGGKEALDKEFDDRQAKVGRISIIVSGQEDKVRNKTRKTGTHSPQARGQGAPAGDNASARPVG